VDTKGEAVSRRDDSCTHTSAWHKEMKPCSVCGAEYSDEESERIGAAAVRPIGFSAAQLEIIRRHEEESGDDL
jgi:hypothetical protein